MIDVGMVHGRFQPFHLGHLEYCLEAAERCSWLVVGLTNPDPERTQSEPADPDRGSPDANRFPYHVRCRMVRDALLDAGLAAGAFMIVPFPISEPHLWSHYVPPTAVHFLRVHSSWGDVKLARIRETGYRAVDLSGGRSKQVSGTEVRRRLDTSQGWEELVPPAVVPLVRAAVSSRG